MNSERKPIFYVVTQIKYKNLESKAKKHNNGLTKGRKPPVKINKSVFVP